MRNFKQLKIWQKGIQIAIDCIRITNTFPKQEKFGIISQLNRACISIASNIAEGSSRSSNKDYNRFIEISLGSCFEAETQFLIASQLGFGNAESIEAIILQIIEEQKMFTIFSARLKA
ncbi:MAG: four helix bundle protein [Ferruginibacter sp.]